MTNYIDFERRQKNQELICAMWMAMMNMYGDVDELNERDIEAVKYCD
jgi:hypothetical protein